VPLTKEILIGIAIVVISVLFFSFKAGDRGFQFTGDENFYFESSSAMVESGDWITPRYFGTPRFQKPILYYWFIALSFAIQGVSWFAARLPSIIFASFIVLMVYLIGLRLFKEKRAAAFTAVILATTFKFFKYSRFAIPDMALLFFVTAAFYFYIRIMESDGKEKSLWPAYFLSIALGMMVKGPIAAIIPVVSIGAFAILFREKIRIRIGDIGFGMLILALCVLPWFIMMLKAHGQTFISQVWTREIAHRVGHYSNLKDETTPLIEYLKALPFYLPILIFRFLPWSIFLPLGFVNAVRAIRSGSPVKKEYTLLLCWFATVFIFFTLMEEKHSQYMLALAPPFAIFVGGALLQPVKGRKMPRLVVTVALIALLGVSSFLSDDAFRLNSAVMGGFAKKIMSYKLTDNDKIGMGSHELIPQKLEVYLKRPVEKVGVRWYNPRESDKVNKLKLKNFFDGPGRSFCIINVKDYERYVSAKDKKRAAMVHVDLLWQRKIEFTKEKLAILAEGEIREFIASFRHRYYLIVVE